MFASSNPLTRHRTIDIMTQIGQRVYTDKAAARRLVSLIRGDNPIVVEHATKALYYIARSPGGAEAAVDANVLDFVVELLESPNTEVRRWTCELLGELSNQKSTAASVLAATPCAQLVSTLNDGNLGIVERATKALSLIATSPNGAKAADDADVTAYTMKLLTSRHSGVKIWTCELLARLAWHKSTRAAVLREKPCRPLVSLLRDHNRVVIATAVKALSIICRSAEGAVAAVNASMLGCMGALLRSTEAQICRRTFQILGALSRHGNTAPAVLEATHDIQIALFRGRRNIHIRSSAISALAQISENPGANAAVLTTDFLQHCSRMMEFEDLKVQFKICVILRNISRDPLRRA
ncbi:armadillo-type protein [Mycena latifolia]|nr:armadillo-type protein [Mycena latifolia]